MVQLKQQAAIVLLFPFVLLVFACKALNYCLIFVLGLSLVLAGPLVFTETQPFATYFVCWWLLVLIRYTCVYSSLILCMHKQEGFSVSVNT